MVSKKKTCSICLESVWRPAFLNLNCQCKYYVHYKCYNKWWKQNKSCIICHLDSPKPKINKRFITPRRIKKTKTLEQIIEKRHNNNNETPSLSIHTIINNFALDYDNRFRVDDDNEIIYYLTFYLQIIFKVVLYIIFCFGVSWLIKVNFY